MRAVRRNPSVDLDRSAVSRYLQLASLFRRRIEAGDWPIGQQTPTVDDLGVECGVARATVRKALDMLEDEGLIERYRAKGTFVRQRPRQQLWCEVATDWSGLLAARDEAVIEVLSDERGFQPSHVPHPIGTLAPSYRRITDGTPGHDAPFLLARLYIDERLSESRLKEGLAVQDGAQADGGYSRSEDQGCAADAYHRDSPTSRHQSGSMCRSTRRLASFIDQWLNRSGCLVFIGEGLYRGDMIRIDMKLK